MFCDGFALLNSIEIVGVIVFEAFFSFGGLVSLLAIAQWLQLDLSFASLTTLTTVATTAIWSCRRLAQISLCFERQIRQVVKF